MAKSGQSDQMKSLKKSNDSLKILENARKDIKRLEERVEVQEHASKDRYADLNTIISDFKKY